MKVKKLVMEDEEQRVRQNKCDMELKTSTVFVRKFEVDDNPEVQRIFYEGLMEMIPDTAFRGLRHHPESLLLYAVVTSETNIFLLSLFNLSRIDN